MAFLVGVILHRELLKVTKVNLSELNTNISSRLDSVEFLPSSNSIFILPHKMTNIYVAETL